MLSTLTLSTIKHLPTSTSYAISPTERLTRGLYRIVVALASGYFFLSIPFLIFLVVGIAGGVIYFFLAVGRIPLNIVGVVGISALYTLFAIIRSVFTRVRQADPGPCLPREEAPQLWTLLEEVASRVGTRPVDTVFVTPFPEIAVTERGGLLKKFTGTGERVLILGLGALPDMTQAQFRAVLAHEYGHFSNRDTAGGGLALQVRASMRNMAYSLAVNHQTHYLNPVWLFLMGYDRVFLRITLGASRLQEILADRQAALAYGARNMIDALTHIVRQSIRFSMQASLELEDALRQRRNPQNLYTLPPIQEETLLKGLNEKFREEMYRATTPYDSHPSIKDRFDLLGEFESSPPSARDDKMVWDLIPRVQELQSSMSHALFKKATLKMSSL
jgi:Zn-dependent protease with chaperone function